MFALRKIRRTLASLAAAAVLVASLASTPVAHAKEKKNLKATQDESAQPKQRNILEGLDTSKLVWVEQGNPK